MEDLALGLVERILDCLDKPTLRSLSECSKALHFKASLSRFGGSRLQIHSQAALARFCALLETAPRLREPVLVESLNLQFCPLPAAPSFPRAPGVCFRLSALNLNGCTSLSDASLAVFADALLSFPERLLQLDLYWVPRITDRGLSTLFSRRFPALLALNLSGMCNLSDESLRVLAAACPRLRTLNLTKLARISDGGLQHLARGCADLRTLILYACPAISDPGVSALVRACPNLLELDLTGSKITDQALLEIARHSLGLETLRLRWCVLLTDAALRSLSALPRLHTLVLFGIKSFSDAGFRCLACGPLRLSLVVLDLNGCSGISDRSLATVQRLFPRVERLEPLS